MDKIARRKGWFFDFGIEKCSVCNAKKTVLEFSFKTKTSYLNHEVSVFLESFLLKAKSLRFC